MIKSVACKWLVSEALFHLRNGQFNLSIHMTNGEEISPKPRKATIKQLLKEGFLTGNETWEEYLYKLNEANIWVL